MSIEASSRPCVWIVNNRTAATIKLHIQNISINQSGHGLITKNECPFKMLQLDIHDKQHNQSIILQSCPGLPCLQYTKIYTCSIQTWVWTHGPGDQNWKWVFKQGCPKFQTLVWNTALHSLIQLYRESWTWCYTGVFIHFIV